MRTVVPCDRARYGAARLTISVMLASMVMARVGGAVLGGLGVLFVGCVESPGAERIVGPDGTQMLHVHCGDEQVACFQIAGERCPHGYDLSPIFDPRDGNFLVRCRSPALTRPVVAAPAATAPSAASNQPRTADWPPSEVAMPTEPWPAPSSSGSPASPQTATDAGY